MNPFSASVPSSSPHDMHSSLGSDQPRLLLVDDEPRLLSSLYELLQGRGYQLVTAATGSEALAHLSRLQFDLVLLDLRLPDIGGHEIMDFINEKGIGADVIVMSGEIGIDAAIGALKRGAYDYLRKPYSREELLKTVANALKQRRLEDANARIANQLENSEKMYRYLVDSSPDIIYTLNHEGKFTFVNDRVQQLLGFTREELIGKHYSILVHDEDQERARYAFNERRVDERADDRGGATAPTDQRPPHRRGIGEGDVLHARPWEVATSLVGDGTDDVAGGHDGAVVGLFRAAGGRWPRDARSS